MSRKVFIHAYAAGNLGDDLLIRILCSRYPDVQFRMWTDIIFRNYYSDIPNLKVCCPTDKWSVRIDKLASKFAGTERGMWKYLIKSSDVTVHIGGSVFVQHSEDYRAAYELDRTLRRLSRRLVVIGANFGPYTDENYLRQYRELLAGYDGVCFRDSYSGRLFGDIPTVRTAPDVAFNCKRIPQAEVRKQVVFSVIDMEHRGGQFGICQYREAYQEALARIAKVYIRDGYELKFLSFCEFQADGKAAQEIAGRLSEEERSHVGFTAYTGDMEDCLRLFEESEVVVGTRFHSIVLGWRMGKKVLPIVYDAKTEHLLEDLHVDFAVKLEELAGLDVRRVTERVRVREIPAVDALVEQADGQFRALDELLR